MNRLRSLPVLLDFQSAILNPPTSSRWLFSTSISRCFEVRYLIDRQLLGVAVVDASPGWLNAVYFYFDPDQGWRSPGTLNILTLNHICKSQQIEYLYLGYWIDGLAGMSYKNAFCPHELFQDGGWREQR